MRGGRRWWGGPWRPSHSGWRREREGGCVCMCGVDMRGGSPQPQGKVSIRQSIGGILDEELSAKLGEEEEEEVVQIITVSSPLPTWMVFRDSRVSTAHHHRSCARAAIATAVSPPRLPPITPVPRCADITTPVGDCTAPQTTERAPPPHPPSHWLTHPQLTCNHKLPTYLAELSFPAG